MILPRIGDMVAYYRTISNFDKTLETESRMRKAEQDDGGDRQATW